MSTSKAAEAAVLQAFTEFDTNLALDETTRLIAQETWRRVTEVLQAAGLASGCFLQGSFARKTMLTPLKDVDIVVLLTSIAASEVGFHADPPLAAMRRIFAAIAEAFPTASPEYGKHALTLTLPSLPFSVDLVPALDGPDQYIQIGNTESRSWERSNVRILASRVSARNQHCAGRFVHQVRMAKDLARNRSVLAELKGITVESLCYSVIRTSVPHDVALANFLDFSREAVTGPIFDPTGQDDLTVKHKWTAGFRRRLSAAFESAYVQASEAMASKAANDPYASIAIWHALIGANFPTQPVRSAAALARALSGGSISSAGVATKSDNGLVRVPTTRAWGC